MADDRALAKEANRLYWESDTSVNRIADELGLSKGALYTLVEPLATTVRCPECSLEMVYLNRTARLKEFLGCPSCGFEAAAATLEVAFGAEAAAEEPAGKEAGRGQRDEATAEGAGKGAKQAGDEQAKQPAAASGRAPAAGGQPAGREGDDAGAEVGSGEEAAAEDRPAARKPRPGDRSRDEPGTSLEETASELDEKAREPVGSRPRPGRKAKEDRPRIVEFPRIEDGEEAGLLNDGLSRNVMAGATLLGIAAGVLIVTLIRRR